MTSTARLGDRSAVLRGRDHTALGETTVIEVDASLALGMTVGARPKARRPLDPNEDVGAVARVQEAAVLVIADGHFGREASELAVDYVLEALGETPPAHGLPDDELVALVLGASVAVLRETTRAASPHALSRTTLALALVSPGHVQWASFGDSSVLLIDGDMASQLTQPRAVYLGNTFTVGDIAGALQRGALEVTPGAWVVLSTDGLTDVLGPSVRDLLETATAATKLAETAGSVVDRLLMLTLERQSDDAATVAVWRA